ncbi:MAG TPA: lytic transglycosylase domain-containing protein [Polyangiales bacterium]|nr:lytic transglycosylase domain-containing protein [Polyangiales bacterium]
MWAALLVGLVLGSAAAVRADALLAAAMEGTATSTSKVRASRPSRAGRGGPKGQARRAQALLEEGARQLQYDAYLREAGELYQLPLEFLRAVTRVESNFDPRVVSNKGAMGLMQLMPATARKMGVADPFDARENILGGARFLRVLANRWNGDLTLTVASYNAGPGAVERYRGIPPFMETKQYVVRVLRHYRAYLRGNFLVHR